MENSDAKTVSGGATVDETRKRKRPDDDSDGAPSLKELIKDRKWEEATKRVLEFPHEAVPQCQEEKICPANPSPLALACRYGAPYACIKAVLEASPERLRCLLDSRGTPLHEAIVCPDIGGDVIEMLLEEDEKIGTESSARATLQQDVDGYTPLHLLIRRRSHTHIIGTNEDAFLMRMLEILVKSCPEAVVVPDRGEYEEPPIVMALKANLYAPLMEPEDVMFVRIEQRIHEMVSCMLRHYPQAATHVFSGYRGRYTALHSAVFHGRCSDTIELLLKSEARFQLNAKHAALLANTQGEVPLHFCAMRGEPPRSASLLAQAAPEAVLKRDGSGLTPLHWLWTRFVGTLLVLDASGRGEDATTVSVASVAGTILGIAPYNEYWSLENGDTYADLQLIRRVDPPVDFLRMRHIPLEVLLENDSQQWSQRAIQVLDEMRDKQMLQKQPNQQRSNDTLAWNRMDAVTSLFWTKNVWFLRAAAAAAATVSTEGNVAARRDDGNPQFLLVHTAFGSSSCLPPVARVAAGLFPSELSVQDDAGRLPLHLAASRPWHAWDCPREDGTSESAAAKLLAGESLGMLRAAMEVSPKGAARVADNDNRLPLHHVIDVFVKACGKFGRSSCAEAMVQEMFDLVVDLVRMFPESLHRRDGDTKLYPFLQAAAAATRNHSETNGKGFPSSIPDELPLSLTYALLRESPTLLTCAEQVDCSSKRPST